MADLIDVANALASVCATALYPNGSGQPSAAAGRSVRIYIGWPNNDTLNADFKNGISHVTVYPMPGMTANLTRFAPRWQTQPTPAATLTVALSAGGAVATISGTPSVSQVVGLTAAGVGYGYRPNSTDTVQTIVAAMAAEIPFATASQVSGFGSGSGNTTITLSYGVFSAAAIGVDTQATAEVGRQRDGFMVSVWSPDPASREAISAVLMGALQGLQSVNGAFTSHMTMADGSDSILKYARTYSFDQGQVANEYRRDLIYQVEYATIITQTFPAMLFFSLDVIFETGSVATFGTQQPPNLILTDQLGNILISGAGIITSPDTSGISLSGPFIDQNGLPVSTGPNLIPPQ